MNLEEYEEKRKSKVPEDINGNLGVFDPKMNISKFKLIFIFQDGTCLFMPYAPGDNQERTDDRYAHMCSFIEAIELILKKLNIDKKYFIQEKVNEWNRDEIQNAIQRMGISFFYDTGFVDADGKIIDGYFRYTIFMKSPILTNEQQITIAKMRDSLNREHYKLSIQILAGDENIDSNVENFGTEEDEDMPDFLWVTLKDDEDMIVDMFFKVLKLDSEKILSNEPER